MDSNKKKPTTTARFIKLTRVEDNPEIETLVSRHHKEFILLTIIAMRARRNAEKCKFTGMEQCQAMIGDFADYGMTRQQYRTAKANLQKWNYITIQATNKGTTATLTNKDVYDINAEATNQQGNTLATNEQPASNHKEECKKEKNAKNITTSPSQAPVVEVRESRQSKPKPIQEEKRILDELDPPRRAIVAEWLAYKKQRKQVYQTIGLKKLIKNWAKFPDAVVQLAIDKSIESNYSGVFFDGIKSTPTDSDQGYTKEIK
jgi:hypothetical protein